MEKYVLDCRHPLFTKITYILSSFCLFGTVSQHYLRCCLLGYSPHFAPSKTSLETLTLCPPFFFLSQQAQAPHHLWKKKKIGTELTISHACKTKISWNSLFTGIQSASMLRSIWRSREGGGPGGGGTGAPSPSPRLKFVCAPVLHPSTCVLHHLLHQKQGDVSRVFPWVLWVVIPNHWAQEGVHGPWFAVKLDRR